MAKVEEYNVDGRSVRVFVHRKGATRASGPGSTALPNDLCDLGQPVLIPGSMGTASYVLIGYDRSHAANVWLHVTWGGSRHEPRRGQEDGASNSIARPVEEPRDSDLCGIDERAGGRGFGGPRIYRVWLKSSTRWDRQESCEARACGGDQGLAEAGHRRSIGPDRMAATIRLAYPKMFRPPWHRWNGRLALEVPFAMGCEN